MTYTLPGALAFAAMTIAAAVGSFTATRLIMSVYGRAPRDWRMIPAVYAFTALLLIAGAVFLYAEPKP